MSHFEVKTTTHDQSHLAGTPLDLAAVRQKLEAKDGPEFWRSLNQLADTPEFREFYHREFPREASMLGDGFDRRNFLRLMGASLALAGVSACSRQPEEKIIPYVKPPEELVPGVPVPFATAMPSGGYGYGVVARSNMGRPVKLDGNPLHSSTLGSSNSQVQAAVLQLYDPDRSRNVRYRGAISTWELARTALSNRINGEFDINGNKLTAGLRDKAGEGIRILTGTVTSPSLSHMLAQLKSEMPALQWHQWDPCGLDNVRAGAKLAFGEHVETTYAFDKADVVLALDCDFLHEGPGAIRYNRDFSVKRTVSDSKKEMNRLYVAECNATLTGALADHALRVQPGQLRTLIRAIAQGLGVSAAGAVTAPGEHDAWIKAVIADLQAHRGACVVVVGENQPADLHALGHAMNQALGNVGSTVIYTDPVEAQPVDQLASLQALVADMNAGVVDTLLMLDVNPVYNAPVDLAFASALDKVTTRYHLGLYNDETAILCDWHVPMAHFLESWGDLRSFDGTATVQQPLIAPLYGGKTALEFLAGAAGLADQGQWLVKSYWQGLRGGADFDAQWEQYLGRGFVPDSNYKPRTLTLRTDWTVDQTVTEDPSIQIAFRPDPAIGDGQWANNGWLQELPKPLTKLTWDNAALISIKTAESLGVTNEDVVAVTVDGRTIEVAVLVLPGQPDNVMTLHLGYGRTRAGFIANGAGVDVYGLRACAGLHHAPASVEKTGKRFPLARTEDHHALTGELYGPTEYDRPIVLMTTLSEFQDAHFDDHFHHQKPHDTDDTMFANRSFEEVQQWGMTIDLNACTGCGSCVMACQAENNIPVVGKEQVIKNRAMHWIRVDRYYKGSADAPIAVHQPVPCMQCERAPCELVCPVGATMHSKEGLNDMVYNRCVGTRYCANNCPYKVRRFNFLSFVNNLHPSDRQDTLELMRNPNVTVRTRGVMEKCTYCVQRINLARIDAKKAGRKVLDGEIRTACQDACPAAAIAFGDVSDAESQVSKLKRESRNYSLLADLNTKPRTTYLAKLRNPNQELEAPTHHGSHHEETH
ncbi:MAG: hypothetical protein AMXMBFR84_43360 [Candidatus Hydrogenedentota bacterium]